MNPRTLTLVIAAFLLGGCVTGRRTFDLPVNAIVAPPVSQGSVYIGSITDDRQFQHDPPDPSIPSISGDLAKLSVTQRDRMIGRQRNWNSTGSLRALMF